MRLFDSLNIIMSKISSKLTNYCLTDKLDFCMGMLMTEHVLIMPQTHPTNQAQILISMGGYAHKVICHEKGKNVQ